MLSYVHSSSPSHMACNSDWTGRKFMAEWGTVQEEVMYVGGPGRLLSHLLH